MQDATKVMLGSTTKSDRVVSAYSSDPATYEAGLAVKLASTDQLSLSSGQLVGISVGESLSDHKKTSVVRAGEGVPLLLTDIGVQSAIKIGDVTFTFKAKGDNNAWTIALMDTKADASAEASYTGTAIVIDMEDSATVANAIAASINDHPELSLLIEAVVDSGDGAVAQAKSESPTAFASGVDSYAYAVLGAPVRIHDTTGKAINTGGTLTSAYYASAPKTGVKRSGLTDIVAEVDFPGGF